MPIGRTIAQYNNESNPYLNKFKKAAVNKTMSDYTPVGVMSDPSTPSNAFGNTATKTAVGNQSSTIKASPFASANQQSQVFQPMYTGASRKGSQYGVLGAIDQQTDIFNAEMSQKIGAARQRQQARTNYAPSNSFFTGGEGNGLDGEQLQNARTIADIGRSRGLDDNAIQIAIMTAFTESSLRNVNYGDTAGPDSRGLFQQRPSQGWGSFAQVQDPNYATNTFYDRLVKSGYGNLSPWAAAQAVQNSAFRYGENYQKNWATAQNVYRSLSQASTGKSNDAAGFIGQYNNKYVDWDGAYGAQCVDLYNVYTQNFVGGKNILVGYAPELFTKYDTSVYTRVGTGQTAGMGYVAIFRPGGATPSGHVAIVVGDNGNGTLRVLHANATSAGSRGNTIISNISKASLMGYLIPNRLLGQ